MLDPSSTIRYLRGVTGVGVSPFFPAPLKKGGEIEMRRQAILLMATMAAALIVAGGVALAETVSCDITLPC
jgi:hypothetical protein